VTGEVAAARAGGDRRIRATFDAVRAEGRRAALMPYLMGGFPDAAGSRAIGLACANAGADLLEVGIPYSDPLADGPVIHAAGARALEAGVRTADVLDVAADLAEVVPVVIMCYANLVYARGVQRFAGELADRGVSGLIVPDLPLEEGPEFLAACDERGVALVPLVAPTTPEERLAAIGARARGFVYTVSVLGTTGERSGVGAGLAGTLARTRAATDVPVALGFGISTPDDAVAAADAGADGVIVGSRLVRAASEAVDAGQDPAAAVGEVVGRLSAALCR
jgi:tryptophan synthase alpha chain